MPVSRVGPTTAFGRVVGRHAYTMICAAAMGIAAPIELQRLSGFIITQYTCMACGRFCTVVVNHINVI